MSSKVSSKASNNRSRKGSDNGTNRSDVAETKSPSHGVRVKLPKINLQKFSGKVEHWQEFWDSFKSAIHESSGLAKVDKFKYLRSYLEEPVRKVVGGLSLTDAGYDSAIQILKNRYARPTQIKRSHISQLLQLPMVYNDRNTTRLRQLYDDIEANFHSLEALGVDCNSYSSIIVPALLQKIPESIGLTMFRVGGKKLEGDIQELLKTFAKELDIRERYVPIFNGMVNNTQMHQQQRGDQPKQSW